MSGGTRNVGRILVRAVGSLSIWGGVLFVVAGLPAIGWYLGLAGVIYWIFTLGWQERYAHVLPKPPDGYRPTGEIYPNPGGKGPVAVYYRGTERVYVLADAER